jgi:hypothetical protein
MLFIYFIFCFGPKLKDLSTTIVNGPRELKRTEHVHDEMRERERERRRA